MRCDNEKFADETECEKFHQLLLSGELSCRELVEYYLRRIEAYDHAGPCLNALILLNPRALEEADAIDAAVRKQAGLPENCAVCP